MLSNYTTLLRMLKNSFYITFLKINCSLQFAFLWKCSVLSQCTFSIEWQAKLDFKTSIFFDFIDGFSTNIKRYWCFSCSISLTPTRYIIWKNVFGNNILFCWLAFIEQLFQYYGIWQLNSIRYFKGFILFEFIFRYFLMILFFILNLENNVLLEIFCKTVIQSKCIY